MRAFIKDSLPGSKIGGYTSSLKMSSYKPHPWFKFYVGTNDPEDLILFSKRSTIDKMEKRVKEEAEMLLKLELQRSQAEALLLDEQRLQFNIQVTRRYLEKLQFATNKYKQAIEDLLISQKMDVNLRMAYTNKLIQQQKLTDPVLVQLQTAVDFFNITNKASHISACMQARIRSIQKSIEAKMNVVLDAHKEQNMLSSLP